MIKRKIFKYAMPISIVMSLCAVFPVKEVSAATNSYVPQVNAYQLNGHAKVELGIDMADEDVIKKEGFESGEVLPSLTWQPFNGNQSFSNDTAYSGSFSEKLTDNIDGLKGNFYSYPNQNSPNSYTSFPDKVQQPANGSWFSVSFKVKSVSGSSNNIDFEGVPGHKSGGNVMTDNRGNQILYKNTTSWQSSSPTIIQVYSNAGTVYLDDGGTYILLSSTSNNYDWGYSYYTWNQAQQTFTWQPNGGNINPCSWVVSRPSTLTTKKDVFYAGSNMITYPGNADMYFSPRSVPSDSTWKTFSMNAQLPNDPKYNFSTQGFIPSFYWSTNGTMYIDDIKFGYASQSNMYRNGQLIHSGYDSDFEDTQAIDTAKPNAPTNVSVTGVSNNLATQWDASIDNGTTYNYTANSVSNKTGAVSATSAPVPVVVTTGVKGYSVVVDNNPSTDPGNNINTTNPSFSSPLGNIDISQPMYIHVKTIDNAGNVSDTVHYQYNYVNYTNALNAVIEAENTKTQTKVDYAQMLINTLPTCGRRTDLQNRLNAVQTYVTNVSNATNAVIKSENDEYKVGSATLQLEINNAQSLINTLPDDPIKTDLQNRISVVQLYVNELVSATNAVSNAEGSKTQTNINIAQPLIDALPVISPEKPILQSRLDSVQKYLNAANAVLAAEISKLQSSITSAQTLVNGLANSADKTLLQNRIDAIVVYNTSIDEATKAVAKAKETYLQSDLDHAQTLVTALPTSKDKTTLQTNINTIQNYINTMKNATDAVLKAETTKTQSDFDNAQTLINTLVPGTVRNDLQTRLDVVKNYLTNITNVTNLVVKAEASLSQKDVNDALVQVNLLPDGSVKTDLLNRLNNVQISITKVNTVIDAVVKAEGSREQVDVDLAKALVDALPDGITKTNLENRLNMVQVYIDKVNTVTNAVIKAEGRKLQSDIDAAQNLIETLPMGTTRTNLQNRLDAIQQSVKVVDDTEKFVVVAENSKLQSDVDIAQSHINLLPNGIDKTNLQNRLDAVKTYLSNVTNTTNAVIKAEGSRSQADITNAQSLIDKLTNGSTKTDLQNRLNAVKNSYTLIQNTLSAVVKAEGSHTQSDIDNAQSLIDKLPAGQEKTDLQNRLNQIKTQISALLTATNAVSKAETSKLTVDVDYAQSLVNGLPTGTDKIDLQNRLNAIKENTNALSNSTSLVEKLEQTKQQSDLDAAQNYINTLPIGSDRYYLQCRLDAVQEYINSVATATQAVVKVEGTKNQFDINAARTLVDALPDGTDKTNLSNRLNTIQGIINTGSSALNAVIKAEKSGLQKDIDDALTLVNQMADGPDKTDLVNRLKALQGTTDSLTAVTNAISKAETSGLQSDVDAALALINKYNVTNSNLKTRLGVVQSYIDDLDLATKAVEKAEQTKLQTDKNYAAPLVRTINDNLYASKKANLQSRLDAVQDYINKLNDSTYGVVKAGITKTGEDATNAQTPIDQLPSATSANNLQDKTNVPSTGTTDKEVLQDGLNNTTNYLDAVTVATNAVVKTENSLLQSDLDYAQGLVNKLLPKNSNLTTRISVVQKQIDTISNATSLVVSAESTKLQTDVNKAKTAVSLIKSATVKADLLSRLDNVQTYIKNLSAATYAVTRVETTKLKADFTKAQSLVSALNDGSDRTNLQNRLDAVKSKLK